MASDAIRRHTISDTERSQADTLLRILSSIGASDRAHVVVVDSEGKSKGQRIPVSIVEAVTDLVGILSRGEEAVLVEEDREISPEEAAPLLGMSRPMVVHRIKQGDIPHRMVGTHHRLRTSDVLRFKQEEDRRRVALAEFGEQTDELVILHGI